MQRLTFSGCHRSPRRPAAVVLLGVLLGGVPLLAAAQTAVQATDQSAARAADTPMLTVPEMAAMPPLEWPECLVRPDVHPQIQAIEAALTRNDLADAQRRVAAHTLELRGAAPQARLDAQLAAAVVMARAGNPQARQRFAAVAEDAAALNGLHALHLLSARAGEGFMALRQGDALAAEDALRSALHLHRMRYGLHDPGQAVYLHALAALADGAAAEEQVTILMRRQLALQRRQLLADEAATGVIEALPALIETLRNSTVFAAMAEPIGELREAVHTQLGNDHPAGVPLLIADAHASALHAIASEGLWDPRHLREAYRLMTSLAIDMPVVDRAHYLVDVGNVWWLAGHRATALAVFKVATKLKVPSATERLGRPEALAWPSGTPRALTDAAAEGWLRLGIRINPRGDGMRVTDAAMSPRQDPVGVARARAWQSAARRAIWRPAVVDGQTATRKDMVIFDRFVPTP